MAIGEAYAGSETVGTTEWSLPRDASYSSASPTTADGAYQVWLDLSALASGDEFQFRIYEKVQSSSTQRVVYECTLLGGQAGPNWVSPTLILLHGWDVTLDKIAGADRAIEWSIRNV